MSAAPILDGAFRIGDHVVLRAPPVDPLGGTRTRVVTIGVPRDLERWLQIQRAADGNPLAFRTMPDDARGLPRFVGVVSYPRKRTPVAGELVEVADQLRRAMYAARGLSSTHVSALVFDVPDGVSLFEIALRTDMQHAVVEPAIAATILARAARLASTPRDAGAEFAPTFEAQTVRVAWDGSIWFLGHESWDRATWASMHLGGMNTFRRGRALIDRFLRGQTRSASLLAWMNVIATSRDDEGLAADPSPWSVVADALDEIVKDLGGAVDDATLAGLAQRLFPDDHAHALELREQIAMLRDDELRAVPDSGAG